jgi:hypothetical protein
MPTPPIPPNPPRDKLVEACHRHWGRFTIVVARSPDWAFLLEHPTENYEGLVLHNPIELWRGPYDRAMMVCRDLLVFSKEVYPGGLALPPRNYRNSAFGRNCSVYYAQMVDPRLLGYVLGSVFRKLCKATMTGSE